MNAHHKELLSTIMATVVIGALQADAVFTWSGGGSDSKWNTAANWTLSSGSSDAGYPANNDTVIFDNSSDVTVEVVNGETWEWAYVECIRIGAGAGNVTFTQPAGESSTRTLQFRQNRSGGEKPGVTNFVNLSSKPVTFGDTSTAVLKVQFGNAWGCGAVMPGAIFNGEFNEPNADLWFLPQTALRTDNVEMNKTVVNGSSTVNGTAHVCANHWLYVNGTLSAAQVSVAADGVLAGSGTIHGAISATTGAKLLFSDEEVLTFDIDADISGLTVDATGCTSENEYLVAKGTTSLPGVSAAHSALGWMTAARNGNVYLVNSMNVIDSDVTLDADADWTATPVSIADNVTIDLNGHNLSVAGITLGSGVTFVNNAAEKSRIYAGLNGGDKTWLLGLSLPASIMPVFCGAAIEIPNTYIPLGGIGFKDTSGIQIVWSESCANGLAVLGNANLKEPGNGAQNWNNVAKASPQFAVTIKGVNNVFTTDGGRYSSGIDEFSMTPFIGDGELILVSNENRSNFDVFGRDRNGSDFAGTLVLRTKATLVERNSRLGVATDASTTRVVISNDMSERTIANTFSLYTPSAWTKYSFSYGMIETAGEHPEIVALFMDYPVNDVHYDTSDMTLNIGGGNLSGAFAGDITNCVDSVVRNWDVNKVGTGVWTLTGTVANGGTFTVAAGGVEFRNGLANVTSLTVASGASVLFAGDMGSSPISLASGSTLKLDASNTGDDVPVVNGDLNLTGVNVYVSQGTYVPSKTEPRELLRVTGTITGFDRNGVSTDIDARGWSFRLVANEDGTTSVVHSRNPGFVINLR